MLSVTFSENLETTDQSFGANLTEQNLELPIALQEIFTRSALPADAEAFMNMAFTFPSEISDTLSWSIQDVEIARSELAEQLEGRVAEVFLKPLERQDSAYGALAPE